MYCLSSWVRGVAYGVEYTVSPENIGAKTINPKILNPKKQNPDP